MDSRRDGEIDMWNRSGKVKTDRKVGFQTEKLTVHTDNAYILSFFLYFFFLLSKKYIVHEAIQNIQQIKSLF